MPKYVAVNGPHTRVIPTDAQNHMGKTRDGDCVPPYGVVEAPRCLAVAVVFSTPADDLETLACEVR